MEILPLYDTAMVEGSLEVKLPTIWRDEKAVSREKSQKRKDQKKEDAGARKGRKVASRNTVFFRGFVAPEGWKVGSLKRRVRRHLWRWEMKSCTPLWREAHLEVKCVKNCGVRTTFGSWDVEKVHAVVARSREAHFQVKMCKAHHCRTTFGSWDVEKVDAVVARSTFPSQNVQNTPLSDHFWKLRCRKSARRCGAKHISKSKCTKHHMFAPLLDVRMLKKCTLLWREAHFEVKMLKAQGFGPLFEVRMSLRFASLHYITLHSSTLHYITLHYTPLHYNYNYTTTSTTLHYTKLHYTTLHYITLHYTTFHYTSLHSLHYTPLQLHSYTPLHSTTLHYTKLHYTTLHYTTLHYTPLHYTTLHYTSLHYSTLHYNYNYTTTQLHSYTPLHSTTLNYTLLHYTPLHYITLDYTPQHHNYNYTTTQLHNYTATQLHSTTLH